MFGAHSNIFCSVFYVLKRKKKFWSDTKIFENLLHKKGLKGGISIDADSGPPRYVLCTLMLRWYLSPSPYFFQIGCGHTVVNVSILVDILHVKSGSDIKITVIFLNYYFR